MSRLEDLFGRSNYVYKKYNIQIAPTPPNPYGIKLLLEHFRNNPNDLQEIITQLRKEKINKIRK